MSENKKYFWFKMNEDFFQSKEIKKLRKIAGGDTFTIIYLKLVLKSLKNGGKLYYEKFEDDIINELALDIDEDIDNVKITFMYLLKHHIIICNDEYEYTIGNLIDSIGSETPVARRVRKHREIKEKKTLQCNVDVTNCNVEIEKDININIELEKDIDQLDFFSNEQEKNANIKEILNHWISCNMIDHSIETLLPKLKKQHREIIKNNEIEKIKQAITNYSTVISDSKYWFTYRWSLWDFLTRGLDKFVDEIKPLDNYLKEEFKKKKNKPYEDEWQQKYNKIIDNL